MGQSDRAGLLYVLAGFSTLSVSDSIIKSMAGLWPPAAMGALRYAIAAFVLAGLLGQREGWRAVWRMKRPGLQWVRGLANGTGTLAMFTALGLMPLAEATTITFTQPMITALLAALFLGERLRPSGVAATAVGFAGVVIVLRPNLLAIGPAALLPLLTAASVALLITANRVASRSGSVLAMQYYLALTATAFLVSATVAGHFLGGPEMRVDWPAWHVLARCAAVAFIATIGHALVYLGTAKAGAATVAPMTYGQLLAAVGLGWVFFNERPDATALLGAAIIVGAGLYLWRINRMRDPQEGVP